MVFSLSNKNKFPLDLNLTDWQKNHYFETSHCQDLYNCDDKIERRNCENLSYGEFMEEYEKKNKPLIIQNITKKYFDESKWNFEVL